MRVGDRFRLSKEAHEKVRGALCRKKQVGLIVGQSRDEKCWVVRFDGQKSTQRWFKAYVAPEKES